MYPREPHPGDGHNTIHPTKHNVEMEETPQPVEDTLEKEPETIPPVVTSSELHRTRINLKKGERT